MILDDEAAVAEWLDPANELNQLIDSYQFPTTLDWHQGTKPITFESYSSGRAWGGSEESDG
ncbi:hypothetical protein HPB50_027879 [Hyalomma asiaticum]|nr:hypothetical protein HPB50_027879 [Hyalomma asiaticum]